MGLDRARIVHVIKDVHDQLATSPQRQHTMPQDVVAKVCTDHGITFEAYRAALKHDPSLAELEQQALMQAGSPAADPGPYDAISRESAKGTPLTPEESAARDKKLLGRQP
jgi:hypothetical protein